LSSEIAFYGHARLGRKNAWHAIRKCFRLNNQKANGFRFGLGILGAAEWLRS